MCEHIRCPKLCHEICDREPCNEPCRKKLKCQHECIGLCGEPCPKLCRICDKETVTEVFFGTEDEPDARFVYLFECKHLVEQTGMDHWIESRYAGITDASNTDDNKQKTIQLPDCPKCKTPLRRNLRYSKYIKKQLKAIEQVKRKQFGEKQKIKEEKELFSKHIAQTLDEANKTLFESEINPHLTATISYNQLIFFKNKWTLFNKITEIRKNNSEKFASIHDQFDLIQYEIKKLQNELFMHKDSSKSQILDDISLELERIDSIVIYFEFVNFSSKNEPKFDRPRSRKIQDNLSKLKLALISKINRFDKVKQEVGVFFKNLRELTSLELTPKERAEIVAAIGLSQGHWFECPKGHSYCIGECGGAMEKAVCPECKEAIGGSNHSLIQTNKVSTKMDGARYGAWSDMANNLGNWRLDDD